MREKLGNWGCCMFVSSKLHLWRYQAQIWSCMSVLPRPHMTLIVQVLIHKMVASTIQNSPFKSKHPESLLSYWICSGLRNKKQGIHSYSHSLHYHQIISHSVIYIYYNYICMYIYIYNFTLFHGHLEKSSYKKSRFHHVSRPSLVPSPASSSRCSAREAEAPEAPRLHSLRRRTSRRQPGVSSGGNLRPDLRVWIS